MRTIREILQHDKRQKLYKDRKLKEGQVWVTACPASGAGRDRFVVYDGQGSGRAKGAGTYYCRRECSECHWKGDAIAFARTFCECKTFGEALAFLKIPDSPEWQAGIRTSGSASENAGRPEELQAPAVWTPKTPDMPPPAWSAWAEALLERSQRVWKRIAEGCPRPSDTEALDALRRRGLAVETALALGIGWIPQTFRVPRAAAGLPSSPEHAHFSVPKGLLLTIRNHGAEGAGRIAALSVRCIPPVSIGGKQIKIKQIAGGKMASFICGGRGRPAFLVESILDAALVWQAGRGAVSAVAAVSAHFNPDSAADELLRSAPAVVIVPDSDAGSESIDGEGERAAMRWRRRYPDAEIVLPVGGKDVGEADLRAREGDPAAMPIAVWLAWAWEQAGLPAPCPAVQTDAAEER